MDELLEHIKKLKKAGFTSRELLDREYPSELIWSVYVDGN